MDSPGPCWFKKGKEEKLEDFFALVEDDDGTTLELVFFLIFISF